MFGSNEKGKLASFVGAGSVFKGDINVKGALRIDGTVDGTVTADSVIVGEKANINGDIKVKTASIGGRVEGNINAEDLVEVGAKGFVHGDITTSKLSIIEGGVYNGRIVMGKTSSKVVELQTKDN